MSQNKPVNNSPKIDALTGTRAIAAIMVVIHHYAGNLLPFSWFGQLFQSGNIAVGYFFVLSGFVLYISQKPNNYFNYLANRFLRITPAYYCALLLTIVVIHYFYPPPDPNLGWQIGASLLFIQAWVPDCTLELNSPAWSLSVEMFFYALAPFLFIIAKRQRWFILIAAAVWLTSQFIHLKYAPQINPLSGSGIYFNPLIHLNQFMIGIVGGILWLKYRERFNNRWLAPAVFALILMLILIRPESIGFTVGLIAPLFMLLIVCIATSKYNWLGNKGLVYLGEISFGIYIYQLPVFRLMGKINAQTLHWNEYVMFYLMLATLLLVAAVSHRYLEQPLLRYVKARRHRKPIPATETETE